MSEVDLGYRTGDAEVDRIMRGYVGVFETAFPGAVRAYYLTGSYAEGTAAPTSDIDVVIVFKDGSPPAADGSRAARRLETYCNLLSPVPVGAGRYPEHQVLDFADRGRSWAAYDGIGRRVTLMLAGHLLYGEDLRGRVPLPPVWWWARACWAELGAGALRYMGELRGSRERLVFPLRYPDPGGEFFGYDRIQRRARDGSLRNTTRGLVRGVIHAANAVLAWKSQAYVVNKAEIARAYRGSAGDQWADLVEAVDRTCRAELGYLVPEDRGARRHLRDLCAEALGLENHFLEQFRAFLLDELAGVPAAAEWLPAELAGWLLDLTPDEAQGLAKTGLLPVKTHERRRLIAERPCVEAWVAGMFGRVRYVGDEQVGGALSGLAGAGTAVVRQAAQASLAALRAAE